MSLLELHDIQGIILTGYGHLPFSSYLFLQMGDRAKAQAWLRGILPEVTHSDWGGNKANKPISSALNIAFTPQGLAVLGIPETSLTTSFAEEFLEGMTERNRSRRLGDVGENAPEYWDLKEEQWQDVHCLLILQVGASIEDVPPTQQFHLGMEVLHQQVEQYTPALEAAGIQILALENGWVPTNQKEHFGFHDGIAKPAIKGSPVPPQTGQVILEPGEFVLGYLNEDGNYPPTPTIPTVDDWYDSLPTIRDRPTLKDFGKNGSYLVFRKLQQDVASFRRYFQETFGEANALMQAKVVGRWPDGRPLVLSPAETAAGDTKTNNFLYMATDPHGVRCPVGSHIRRTNPRDSLPPNPATSLQNSNRRQILRRGASYGLPLPENEVNDDGSSRGLLFFCINANIRRQFEFIQHTWVQNASFNSLQREIDPLIGNPQAQSSLQMTVPQESVRQQCGLSEFVTVKGGGYFFLPSISSLHFLAQSPKPKVSQAIGEVNQPSQAKRCPFRWLFPNKN